MYRLLSEKDVIKYGDEFLDDNCESWTKITQGDRWTNTIVGLHPNKAIKPVRRVSLTKG